MECSICSDKVYCVEKIEANGRPYHKSCFRCTDKGCRLNITNFHSYEGQLYCWKHLPKLQAVVRSTNSGARSRYRAHNRDTLSS